MIPPIHTLDFLGHNLVFMKVEYAIATGAWYLFLVGVIMYLANRPQSTPSRALWSVDTGARAFRNQRRRRK